MSQSYFSTKEGKTTLKIICIVASYIVLYGVFGLMMGLLENNSIAFIIFLIICMAFTFKACKGMLVNHLSNLPWPAFIVILILLSGVIGVFVAPYYIGRWIAEKISNNIPTSANNTNSPAAPSRNSTASASNHSPEYNRIYQNLNQMNEKQIDEIRDAIFQYLTEIPLPCPLPGTNQTIEEANRNHAAFCKKPLPNGPVCGCRTYGEVEELNKAAVRRLDAIEKNK